MTMDSTPGARGKHNVQTPGLYKRPAVLATGQAVIYYYAWRNGPRLHSAPHSPEFIAEWQAAVAGRGRPARAATGTLQDIIGAYRASADYRSLADATREGYARRIAKVEDEFGDLPIKALANPSARGIMLDWRDGIAAKHPREADYCLSVLQAILSWAWNRRRIPAHPLERNLGRVYHGTRIDRVYQAGDIALILMLTWAAYDGTALNIYQTKTGARVRVPVTKALKSLLDATPRIAVTICTTSRGTPWTRDGFKTSWGKVKPAGLTFHDLRGTAVTRLAVAGCTTPEIASITGHSLTSVATILEKHYLHNDPRIAESAVIKLEKHKAGTVVVKCL
jgi:integrase